MKCYAVIDTNVLVSALLRWDSVPGQVVQQTYAHEIIPVFNDSILQEYEEVLSRKKFHFPKETVDFLISRLKSIDVNLAAVETLVGDFPDPKDVVFSRSPWRRTRPMIHSWSRATRSIFRSTRKSSPLRKC